MERDGLAAFLLVKVAGRGCALRVEDVSEVMRPLPVEPLAGVPAFVQGLAVVRGEAVPVLDLAAMLGANATAATRFVTVKAGPRPVALAVDAVEGLWHGPGEGQALPPLVEGAAEAVEAVATLDRELVLVLAAARLVPEALWPALAAPARRPA